MVFLIIVDIEIVDLTSPSPSLLRRGETKSSLLIKEGRNKSSPP
jgi:hypothetical protein